MIIYQRNIGQSKCTKVPKYLLTLYEKMKNNPFIPFEHRNINYKMSDTKFDSVVLLSKFAKNTQDIKYALSVSIIGPLKNIKNIHFKSTNNNTAIIGTHELGTQTIAKYNYMIEYMKGWVQIKKDQKYGQKTTKL